MSQETSLLAMRFSRVNAAGTAAPGANNGYAVLDPVKLDLQFQYDTGTDVVVKDGAGRICFSRKRPDNLKNAQVKFEVCGGSPQELEIIINGDGHTIGGVTPTGFGLQNASCGSTVRQGIFIEWWTENYLCNAVNPTTPNARHFLPRVICNYDGGTWDESKHAFAFTGVANAGVVNAFDATTSAVGNTAGGPFNDISGFALNQGYLYGFTAGQNEDDSLAALVADQYITVPAQS